MEPFRALVVDSAVVNAINTRMVTERDFVCSGAALALTAAGRKGFYRAYELLMDQLVKHPLFEYRMAYRRMFRGASSVPGEDARGGDGGIYGFCYALGAS